jgi:tRNA pseudouridine55 synthase
MEISNRETPLFVFGRLNTIEYPFYTTRMNGLLVIDKPEGLTSHDVVNRVRRILKTKRVGHTGTLDPFATGVMVILVGQATRLAQFLDKDEKEYEALVRVGWETDTGDRTGMRTAVSGMRNAEVERIIAETDWEEVLSQFRGRIEQIPPMYSAKKVDGKKLYELARKGIAIQREPVTVNIRKLEILNSDEFRIPHSAIRIHVVCSAGTYIRTLAEDIGRAIGTGAHLEELRRTRAGRFELSRSLTLEELAELAEPAIALLPATEAVAHLRQFILPPARVEKARNGLSSRFAGEAADGEAIQMLDEDGDLIAVGTYNAAENTVQPKVVLV